MKLRSSQFLIADDGGIIMGSGRLAILESVDRTRSINQTAKELKMSYKSVWSKIKSTEKNFGKPVVLADKITGTKLTDEGRALIERYRELKDRCIRADDAVFEDIFSGQG
jgi:molybdate transport system regulatory protein